VVTSSGLLILIEINPMAHERELVEQEYSDVLKELSLLDKAFNDAFQTYVAKRSSLISRGKELEKTSKDPKSHEQS
jgi:hypothetical protein